MDEASRSRHSASSTDIGTNQGLQTVGAQDSIGSDNENDSSISALERLLCKQLSNDDDDDKTDITRRKVSILRPSSNASLPLIKPNKMVVLFCPKCSHMCCGNEELDAHLKEAHKDVQVSCDLCAKPYKDKRSLRDHLRNKHPESIVIKRKNLTSTKKRLLNFSDNRISMIQLPKKQPPVLQQLPKPQPQLIKLPPHQQQLLKQHLLKLQPANKLPLIKQPTNLQPIVLNEPKSVVLNFKKSPAKGFDLLNNKPQYTLLGNKLIAIKDHEIVTQVVKPNITNMSTLKTYKLINIEALKAATDGTNNRFNNVVISKPVASAKQNMPIVLSKVKKPTEEELGNNRIVKLGKSPAINGVHKQYVLVNNTLKLISTTKPPKPKPKPKNIVKPVPPKPARPPTNVYNCICCSFCSRSKRGLMDHINTHPEQQDYNCRLCNTKFSSKRALIAHMVTYKQKKIECDQCHFKSLDAEILRQHMLDHKEAINCLECDDIFYDKTVYDVHKCIKNDINYMMDKAIEVANTELICGGCSKVFIDKSHYIIHMINSKCIEYICNDCNYKTFRKEDWQEHCKSLNHETSFKCDSCYNKFTDISKYIPHRKKHMSFLTFECEYCEFKCSKIETLIVHLKMYHTMEAELKCEICSFATYNKICMEVHENEHKNLVPHKFSKFVNTGVIPNDIKCGGCSEPLIDDSHYIIHMNNSICIQYCCNDCNFKTYARKEWQAHCINREHLTLFVCDYCRQKFRTASNYLEHRDTHSDYPYPCEHCEHKFLKLETFITHLKMYHTQSSRLKCPECSFQTYNKICIDNHMKEHGLTPDESKSNTCQFCDFSISGPAASYLLFKHIDTVHMNLKDDEAKSEKSPETSVKIRTYSTKEKSGFVKLKQGSLLMCPACDFTSHSRSCMNRHVLDHTGDDFKKNCFKCKLCEKPFRSRNALHLYYQHLQKYHPQGKPSRKPAVKFPFLKEEYQNKNPGEKLKFIVTKGGGKKRKLLILKKAVIKKEKVETVDENRTRGINNFFNQPLETEYNPPLETNLNESLPRPPDITEEIDLGVDFVKMETIDESYNTNDDQIEPYDYIQTDDMNHNHIDGDILNQNDNGTNDPESDDDDVDDDSDIDVESLVTKPKRKKKSIPKENIDVDLDLITSKKSMVPIEGGVLLGNTIKFADSGEDNNYEMDLTNVLFNIEGNSLTDVNMYL